VVGIETCSFFEYPEGPSTIIITQSACILDSRLDEFGSSAGRGLRLLDSLTLLHVEPAPLVHLLGFAVDLGQMEVLGNHRLRPIARLDMLEIDSLLQFAKQRLAIVLLELDVLLDLGLALIHCVDVAKLLVRSFGDVLEQVLGNRDLAVSLELWCRPIVGLGPFQLESTSLDLLEEGIAIVLAKLESPLELKLRLVVRLDMLQSPSTPELVQHRFAIDRAPELEVLVVPFELRLAHVLSLDMLELKVAFTD